MRGARRALAGLSLILLAGGCAEPLSDTGFVGRWSRGERAAVIHIGSEEQGLTFCAEKLPLGQAQQTICDGPDRSIVYSGAEPSYAYEYRLGPGADERELLLEASGAPIGDRRGTPIRWKDRLTLEPDGLAFVSETFERNGEPLDPPAGPYLYRKLSDRP